MDNNYLFSKPVKKTGLQLYTLRKVLNDANLLPVMEKIASIGYKELEIFGYNPEGKFWGLEPKLFKKLLKANGLTAPAAHISFENFLTGSREDELKMICEAAKAVGNRYVIVAWLEEKYRRHADDYKRLAARLSDAAVIARQYGLQLAYHNHDFEFRQLDNNMTGYDIILKNTDKDHLHLELDLYWTVKAGKDPVELFRQNPGRFPLWHVKDMDKLTGSFKEVGQGVIDFKAIFRHKELAGLRHFFVEQDEVSKDVFESITESFRYVKDNLI